MSLYAQFTEQEIALLQARAERFAISLDEGRADDLLTTLTVKMGGEIYALPIDSITAVYEGVPVIPLPCVPAHVEGIANIRGHMITVLNLAALVGVGGDQPAETPALIVATNGDFHAAFCVEKVDEVTTLKKSDLFSVSSSFDFKQTSYLRGVLADGTALLDVAAILNDPALITDETIA